uniref:Uncharacterized protein n=1 Tax=Nelumbo nucifera TaxID=4432 RepID=A0A822YI57_NELNU|nr:TPA_asm: hypothetical protein HUJ06_030596 [Nelumbo nucifera]
MDGAAGLGFQVSWIRRTNERQILFAEKASSHLQGWFYFW